MDRKLIFLDIDGTFVSAMKAPTKLATRAVRSARGNGNKVFLCTGRNMASVCHVPLIKDHNFDKMKKTKAKKVSC